MEIIEIEFLFSTTYFRIFSRLHTYERKWLYLSLPEIDEKSIKLKAEHVTSCNGRMKWEQLLEAFDEIFCVF